jgi:hypothetical protein
MEGTPAVAAPASRVRRYWRSCAGFGSGCIRRSRRRPTFGACGRVRPRSERQRDGHQHRVRLRRELRAMRRTPGPTALCGLDVPVSEDDARPGGRGSPRRLGGRRARVRRRRRGLFRSAGGRSAEHRDPGVLPSHAPAPAWRSGRLHVVRDETAIAGAPRHARQRRPLPKQHSVRRFGPRRLGGLTRNYIQPDRGSDQEWFRRGPIDCSRQSNSGPEPASAAAALKPALRARFAFEPAASTRVTSWGVGDRGIVRRPRTRPVPRDSLTTPGPCARSRARAARARCRPLPSQGRSLCCLDSQHIDYTRTTQALPGGSRS